MPVSKKKTSSQTGVFNASGRDECERLKEKLAESEKKRREIFENIQDVFFEVEINGTIIELSPSIVTATKYKREDLLGQSIYNLYSDQSERERLLNGIKKSGKVNDYEITLKDKDGTLIPSSVSAKFVLDAGGKPIRTIGIIRNITERKREQDLLAAKTAILNAQLETSTEGILAIDNEGHMIISNKRFGEMWKIPQKILDTKDDKKMLAQVMSQLKDPEEFSRKVEYLYKHQNEKSREEIEFIDGRWFDRYSSPLSDGRGKSGGRIWFFRDITEQKNKITELERMNRLMVGRELKMVELKKEINELKKNKK